MVNVGREFWGKVEFLCKISSCKIENKERIKRDKGMWKASAKDIFRTIGKEKKRFFSIMIITILGVTMMTGLQAGCEDLRLSADQFYDAGNLFDISILSTLGLTEEDVKAITQLEGVEKAEGSYSEVVHTKKGNVNKTAEVKMIQEGGLNLPYLLEGRLPTKPSEIAVTSSYLKDTGKQIGDYLEIEEILEEDEQEKTIEKEEQKEEDEGKEEEDKINFKEFENEEEKEEPNFFNTRFQITGIVIDVMDINNAEGSAAFRATPNADYTFFIDRDGIKIEAYSAVYVALEGVRELICYTEEYEEKVADVVEVIETDIMKQREESRYQEIQQEAFDKIEEKELEMNDAFTEAEEEFVKAEEEIADARKEISDGWKELEDGRKELEEKETEAYQEIADAKVELEDAYEQLNQGWAALNDAEKEINIGEAKLDEGRELLILKEKEAKEQLEEAKNQLDGKIAANHSQLKEISSALDSIKEALEMMGTPWDDNLEEARKNYVEATIEIIAGIMAPYFSQENPDQAEIQAAVEAGILEKIQTDQIYGGIVYQLNQALQGHSGLQMLLGSGQIPGLSSSDDLMNMITSESSIKATGKLLEGAYRTYLEQKEYAESQIAAAWAEIEAGERELAEGRKQLSAGREEVIVNYEKYKDGIKELAENEEKAIREFAEARQDLLEGEQELVEGEAELADGILELEENREEYNEKKTEAEEKIREAKEEVMELDMTKWYVQDRFSLSGYSNVKSDTGAIESLATVFAVVFFVVAILISLTTVTRMVEEERGLIGTYKALGFQNGEIGRKYLIYALSASGIGALLGDVGGFVILPEILFVFFRVMYLFPAYFLQFDPLQGSIAGCLFILGVGGAALTACYSELKHFPAYLMRPKAPRAGTRVLLERITPVWKRMSFLNKVTARNLFRYKKRMIMTLFGIAGCTALLVFGLAIKDSVSELMPLQYENVIKYDLLSVTSGEDNEKLLEYVKKNHLITNYTNLQIESVKIKNREKDTEKVQLMIFENATDFQAYLTLTDENLISIEELKDGIYLTENAAKILKLQKGDTAFIQRLDLVQEEFVVTELIKNYLGNNIYMVRDTYEKSFGNYEPNGILADLSKECEDHVAFSDELAKEDWILSSVSTEELKDGFSAAFTLINLVVYVVLVLAAGLAFVVLFTLASINISERERELATIKVLGFFDKEVHSYVNKETMILTILGILIGLPAGAMLSSMLTEVLNMPSIYFAVTIYERSYFIAAAIAIVFALIVQILTNRSLNVIDPVEALKSIE